MTSRRLACALLVLVVLLSPLSGVEACGPDFEPDVFVRASHPDDMNAFARGHLGILQTGFDSNEYAVAYRYLNGGKVSVAHYLKRLHNLALNLGWLAVSSWTGRKPRSRRNCYDM